MKGEGRGTNDESDKADEKPEVKDESSGSGLVRKFFGSEDLRTKPEAYTRSKILELEHEVRSLEGSTRHRDQARMCKLKYSLKIFKNEKVST